MTPNTGSSSHFGVRFSVAERWPWLKEGLVISYINWVCLFSSNFEPHNSCYLIPKADLSSCYLLPILLSIATKDDILRERQHIFHLPTWATMVVLHHSGGCESTSHKEQFATSLQGCFRFFLWSLCESHQSSASGSLYWAGFCKCK